MAKKESLIDTACSDAIKLADTMGAFVNELESLSKRITQESLRADAAKLVGQAKVMLKSIKGFETAIKFAIVEHEENL